MTNGYGQIREILISVATYRRPHQLRELLDSLRLQQIQPGRHIRVVVVDNDPDMTAQPVCEAVLRSYSSDLDLHYYHESRPGISYARNEGLRHLGSADAVAFIDDDELAEVAWIEQLAQAAEKFSADVVAGPVLPKFPTNAPAWMVRQGWFERPQYTSGDDVRWPATNNSLVRRCILERLSIPFFDPLYALSGGSDTFFYARCRAAGARIVWSSEAVVSEWIPYSRLSVRWLWRRNVRLGNVSGAMQRRRHNAAIVLAIGIGRVLYGTCLTVPVLLFRQNKAASVLAHIPRGVGVVSGVLGSSVVEYQREGSSKGSR